MGTWHVTIILQAPRGAVITDDTVTSIHDARPEFTMVSHLADNLLEFMADADHSSSDVLFATACRRAAEASTDVLGFPVEFIRGEVIRHDHWLDQIDPNRNIRGWTEPGNEIRCGACDDTVPKVSAVITGWRIVVDTHYDEKRGEAILMQEWQCRSCASGAHSENAPTNGTFGGVELTDDLVAKLAQEAEAGYPTEQLRPRPKEGS
jgi:hypothetical protein